MRIGAFELNEALPALREPHAIAMLKPWIDAGDIGTLTLSWLEKQTGSRPLAQLARPGNFFDFTRYRPITYNAGGQRHLEIPNTFISYGRRGTGPDFVFLHLLEPHHFAEYYVDSIVRILSDLKIKRFCLIGSMYDFVTHTRPLLVSGRASEEKTRHILELSGVSSGNYQGPTTICSLISQKAGEWGAESVTMIVHLPQYTQLDEDYIGVLRVEEIISSLYGIPVSEESKNRARRQREQIDEAVAENPQVQEIIEQLEERYDVMASQRQEEEEERPSLSPQVEEFLREMERRFRRE